MAWSYVNTVVGSSCTTAASCTVTITGVTAGHALFVNTQFGYSFGETLTSFVVTDNHSNTYSNTAQSPVELSGSSSLGFVGMSYLLTAPSGSSTITATVAVTGGDPALFIGLSVYEFAYTGIGSYDKDAAAAFNSGIGGSPITSPSITPANTGEFLLGMYTTDQGSQTGANSPWTTMPGDDSAAYILSSATGTTSANFNDSVTTGDSQGVILAAFLPGGGSFVPDEDFWVAPSSQPSDSIISIL